MIRLGSMFDGIGGFPFAATLNGITPVWASEIEPFPMRVTEIRFPNMKHLGDVTKINGAEIEPVDIITFGSPCQDLSIAGIRKGLDGERSGLFRRAVRVISEMLVATNGQYPRFVVWENVPGALSSNKGKDFREVIESLCGLAEKSRKIPMPRSGKWAKAGLVTGGGYSVAWRVLDAQYWGVAQRRCRIYALVDLRGQCAGKILFEREGVRWNFTESRSKGQGIAGSIESGAGNADSQCVVHPTVAGTLCASGAGMSRPAGMASETDLVVATFARQRSDEMKESAVASTIAQRDYKSASDLIVGGYKVRRLTPLECERLQGYPDNWTNIPGASDTARYKALGNSVAIPCVEFVIGGIAEVLRRSDR